MKSSIQEENFRFPILEILRLCAALMVMYFHLTWQNANFNHNVPIGFIGVQIFFVLSGFLILRSAEKSTARGFFVSRLMRIYPAAIICTLINGIFIFSSGGVSKSLGIFVNTSRNSIIDSFTLFWK